MPNKTLIKCNYELIFNKFRQILNLVVKFVKNLIQNIRISKKQIFQLKILYKKYLKSIIIIDIVLPNYIINIIIVLHYNY